MTLRVERITGFLEKLFEIKKSGKFIDSTTPVIEGEKFVGEMSLLEKACWTLLKKLDEEVERKMGKEDFLEICSAIKVTVNLIMEIMWDSVQERLDLYGSPLAIREGFRIVTTEISEEEEMCDCSFCQLRNSGVVIRVINDDFDENLSKRKLNG